MQWITEHLAGLLSCVGGLFEFLAFVSFLLFPGNKGFQGVCVMVYKFFKSLGAKDINPPPLG